LGTRTNLPSWTVLPQADKPAMFIAAVVLILSVAAVPDDSDRPTAGSTGTPTLAPATKPGPKKEIDVDANLAEAEDRRRGPDSRRDQILGRPNALQAVEQGVEDINTLGASLRQLQLESSAAPMDFQRVYRVPGEPGKLMRGDGALIAVFPFSEYQSTKKGPLAVVPAATVFRIGQLTAFRARRVDDPFQDAPTGRMERRVPATTSIGGEADTSSRIDRRIDMQRADVTAALPPTNPIAARGSPIAARDSQESRTLAPLDPRLHGPLPRIIADEDYRRAFFQSLRRAAD